MKPIFDDRFEKPYWVINGILITKTMHMDYCVHTPKIECYFKKLNDAISYLKDKRRIKGLKRRASKNALF